MTAICSEDSERSVIGAVILRPASINEVALEPTQFYHLARQAIWRQLLAMRDDGTLGDEDVLLSAVVDAVPGVRGEWLACTTAATTADNIVWHADVIREHALTRATLAALGDIADIHRTGKAAGGELVGAAQGVLQRLAASGTSEAWTMKYMAKRRMDELDRQVQAYQRGENPMTGLPTGIPVLDEFLGGYQQGIVTMLLGRPAMGKSSAVQAAVAASCEAGHGVHVFSMEDRWQSFVDRAWSRSSRVPVQAIRTARIPQGDWTRFVQAVALTAKWSNFRYEPTASLTAEQLIAKVRRERAHIDTKLVVVDYIQLLRWSKGMKDHQKSLDHAANLLAQAAKEDEIAYLVACQMSRACERRPDRRPMMSDARDSGALEQCAKTMIGLYRDAVYDPDTADRDAIELLVLKNNDGDIGRLRAHWHGPTTTIS